jgi:hypothetical protein
LGAELFGIEFFASDVHLLVYCVQKDIDFFVAENVRDIRQNIGSFVILIEDALVADIWGINFVA